MTWVTEVEIRKISDGGFSRILDTNLPSEYHRKVKHKLYSGTPGSLTPIQWPAVKTAVNALNISQGINYWPPIPSEPQTPSINGATWDAALPAWNQTLMTPTDIPSDLNNLFKDMEKDAEKIRDHAFFDTILERWLALPEDELYEDETFLYLVGIMDILDNKIYQHVILGIGGLIDET